MVMSFGITKINNGNNDIILSLEELINNVNEKIENNHIDNPYPLLMKFINYKKLKTYVFNLIHFGYLEYDYSQNVFIINKVGIDNKDRTDYVVDKLQNLIERGKKYFTLKDLFDDDVGIPYMITPSLFGSILKQFESVGVISRYSKKRYCIEDEELLKVEFPNSRSEILNLDKKLVDWYLARNAIIIEDIPEIRSLENEVDRLYAAGEILKKSSVAFNDVILAMVLFGDEWDKNSLSRLRYLLKKEFADKPPEDTPYIHRYRAHMGIYRGNYDSSSIRKGYVAGRNDLMNNIRVPKCNNVHPALWQLIGVMLGDGHINLSKHNHNPESVVLSGRKQDFLFYSNCIKPRIVKFFNYEPNIVDNGGYPTIYITSRYIASWAEKKVFDLENYSKISLPIFEGLLAAMGDISKNTRKRYVRFNSNNWQLLDKVNQFLEAHHFSPHKSMSKKKKGDRIYTEYVIRLFGGDAEFLLSEISLINPYHRKIFRSWKQPQK